MIRIPEGYIRRKSSTIPFGYELDEKVQGYLRPIASELEELDKVTEMVHNKSISLAAGVEILQTKTARSLSRMGLKKVVDKKYEERLGNKSKSLLDRF
jgi:hypothetical protein